MEKHHKKNLMEFYETLPNSWSPKQAFVTETARACGVTECTVRNWIKGRNLPTSPAHLKYLSSKTGIPVEELFPRQQRDMFGR